MSRGIAIRAGLVLMGTLVGLALVEAGFHLYSLVYPPDPKGFFWVRNADYGWGLAAGRTGISASRQGEFRTRVHINSHGLRDVEHRYAKDAGVFRVLVLGDSYVEALQVDLEQTFGRVLERELAARSGRRVEVVAAGVSAWATDSELLYFRHEGYKYRPDLVLLAFTTSNDVRENYAPYNRLDPWANLSKPTFLLNDGALDLQPGAPVEPLPWWRRFYVGDFLYRRLGGRVMLPRRGQNAAPPSRDPQASRVPVNMLVHAPEYRVEVREAWRVTEALIRTLRDEAVAKGARFAVMVHEGPWTHELSRWRLMFALDPVAAKTWDRNKPRRLVDAFLRGEEIPFVDVFSRFEAAKRGAPLFFRFDPHWTPAGHRIAAEAAAEFLTARGLVPAN